MFAKFHNPCTIRQTISHMTIGNKFNEFTCCNMSILCECNVFWHSNKITRNTTPFQGECMLFLGHSFELFGFLEPSKGSYKVQISSNLLNRDLSSQKHHG